jgi:hypothetical protein
MRRESACSAMVYVLMGQKKNRYTLFSAKFGGREREKHVAYLSNLKTKIQILRADIDNKRRCSQRDDIYMFMNSERRANISSISAVSGCRERKKHTRSPTPFGDQKRKKDIGS